MSLELSTECWGGLGRHGQGLAMTWVAVPLRAIARIANFGYGVRTLDVALARSKALSLRFGLHLGRGGGQGGAVMLEQVPHIVRSKYG